MGALNVFTYTLTNDSLTITAAGNAVRVSIMCRLGTISYEGTASFQGLASTSFTLTEGQGVTIVSSTVTTPIDGLTITAGSSGDIADILISMQ